MSLTPLPEDHKVRHPAAHARVERGQRLTDAEVAVINRNMMYGSDGYPITKLRTGKYLIDSPALQHNALHVRKRDAVEAWESYVSILIDTQALWRLKDAGVAIE
jgi:hypothetical protein